MDIILKIIEVFVVYGGGYAAMLATASSFYAAFFFFYTRTGPRKNKIDLETKKVYLHVIYATLRISLYVLIISKIAEFVLIYFSAQAEGVDLGFMTLLTSQNIVFPFLVMAVILINSTLMIFKKISFSFALPIAIVSYFALFVALTFQQSYIGLPGYLTPALPGLYLAISLYVAALAIGYIVFNYYSDLVRKDTE